MLPGFLTTALEIIIILDVCGAIAYFTISGLMRIKDKKDNTPALPNSTPGMPALATEGLAIPATLPARISAHVYHPIVEETAAPQEPPQKQWTAGLRQRITTMTRKFTYRPTNGGQAVQTQSLDTDYAKLGRVLDSFKEET